MRTPSNNTCHGKHRCIEFQWKIQHAVYKSTVKINIGADTLINTAFFCNHLWSHPFNHGIQTIIFHTSFFFCEAFYKSLKNFCSRIGNRINCMSHTIDQATSVKCFFMKKVFQICTNFLFIFPVTDFFLHILEHLNNLDIRTAMFRAFQ